MVEKKTRISPKTLLSSTGLLAFLALLILLNAALAAVSMRWDVTEDKTYSLSDGTRQILGNLSHPVNVKFYFSRSNPEMPVEFKLYAKRVWEFLLEYEYAAGGKVVLQRYDPQPDSLEEEWALKYGLNAMQSESGDMVFFGLVFLQADQEERIAWLDPSQANTLEYDLSRILFHLQHPKRKVIGVVSYLPVFGGPTGAPTMELGRSGVSLSPQLQNTGQVWTFISELNKIHEVRKVAVSEDRIDPAIDLLLVIHPKDLHPDLRFAIDQYVLAGKNAIFFVDPSCSSDTGTQNRQYIAGSDRSTRDLFAAWGISVDFAMIVGDIDYADRGGSQPAGEGNPFHIAPRGAAFNQSNLLTAKLESMRLPKAGAITQTPDSPYEFEPLIQSGKQATLMPAGQTGDTAATVRSQLSASNDPYNLAVRIRGKFKTAFPEGPIGATDPLPEPQLIQAEKSATILIVADADMLADASYIRRVGYYGYETPKIVNDNLNFLVNACEILTGSDDLIGLRTRGTFERPFTRVLEIERKAQAQWRVKEKELLEGMATGRQKIRNLEQFKDPTQKSIGLSPKQAAEIEKLKAEQKRVTRELKTVRKNLRADVETLGVKIKVINIFLVPLLVAIAGVGFGIYRQRKMKDK
ncbi:MAG: GldG family protein [Deltaproteobacteria bacterium]|nr:GldG family protein [Deltaproteobacteria bacterium]